MKMPQGGARQSSPQLESCTSLVWGKEEVVSPVSNVGFLLDSVYLLDSNFGLFHKYFQKIAGSNNPIIQSAIFSGKE